MITSRMAEKADGEWLDIDNNPEQLFRMLADAIKSPIKNAVDIAEQLLADAIKSPIKNAEKCLFQLKNDQLKNLNCH